MIHAKDIKIIDNDLFIDEDQHDFVFADSDQQHVQDIIESYKGWWKEFPLVGVGIDFYKKSSGTEPQLKREVKLQLENDGYRMDTFSVDSNFVINVTGQRIK